MRSACAILFAFALFAATPPEQPTTILIAAAASLEYALVNDIIPLFEETHSGITVTGTFASSGHLQAQIEMGLPADIFMPVSFAPMQALVDAGFINSNAVTTLLENRLVLIRPAGHQDSIRGFTDARYASLIAIGDPAIVPAGRYAKAVFTALGIWEDVEARASFASRVTEVLHWVAEGGAELGVVYATDAARTDRVEVIASAADLLPPILYPTGILSHTHNSEAAAAFVRFLHTEEALSIFAGHGFYPYQRNITPASLSPMRTFDSSPILLSMKTASASIFITFFLGIFAAYVVSGMKSKWLPTLCDSILTIPLVLPPTVVGFILLFLFGSGQPIGRFFLEFFGIRIAFSWTATVLAAVVISFPLMYRSARGALAQVDENLAFAARTLGLSEWRVFWRVVFPVALPGIASGGILAFARGLGEFGATAMIAGNIAGQTRTIPLAVYSYTVAGYWDAAFWYVAVIVLISFTVVGFLNYNIWSKKKTGAPL